MLIHFYLRYNTNFGQSLSVCSNAKALGNDSFADEFDLTYLDSEFWYGKMELAGPDIFNYRYILNNEDGTKIIEGETERVIELSKNSSTDLILIDTWNHAGSFENTFYTQAFRKLFSDAESPLSKVISPKFFTHQFKVKVPLLKTDEVVIITGSGKSFKKWDMSSPLFLKPHGNWHSIEINRAKESFSAEYKYGIYNVKTKKLVEMEQGNNRLLFGGSVKNKTTIIHDGFVQLNRKWKGAGVAIPVFSLRSKNSFGVGEFTDIKLLIDWAKHTGLKLIQLLPVNDTTATHTWKDSYPYAAISAFALHPIYINLDKIAGKEFSSLIKPLNKKRKTLNNLPEFDYEQVMKFKFSVCKELYNAKKESFKNDPGYFNFFDLNRDWLVPYAVFCFLRDKYKTPDFTKWRTNSLYSEDAIQKLASPAQKHYDDIAVHYFTQYHLHLQLKEATDYAHKKNIVLKGDIPIGIYRYGCDAWINPQLYNMDEQAGAPPDDFAVKGQNWGFPTYNWKKMQMDGFTWWRNRFEKMSDYFDAFRIDHILGFFRIWSIPLHAVEGVLGRFIPAIPVHINEFHQNGIWFDHHRYCKPFITNAILQDTFGDVANSVKVDFLNQLDDGTYDLKEQFNNQRKINDHFDHLSKNSDQHPANYDQNTKEGLFNLISNVILLEEESSQMQQFHFRIAMDKTSSFQHLDAHTQQQLKELYINYFFRRQDDFWKKEAMQKLPELKQSTNMLVCGEDLGMVPGCVHDVMNQLGILSLEIQRMPKDSNTEFFHPRNATYLSVVTPSTHDMSIIRSWWQEDPKKTQRFYNYFMGHYGEAPFLCEPSVNKEIVFQHLYSPAMWSVFQMQDLLGCNEKLRRTDPDEERINQPADPQHYWHYRMHINLEDLIREKEFNEDLKDMITVSERL